MTDKEIRIKIAEFCGWSNFEWAALLFGTYCKGNKCWDNKEVPSYLTDLNAMHEAEKQLSEDQWDTYTAALPCGQIVCAVPLDNKAAKAAVHATARQRAMAFIKTIK